MFPNIGPVKVYTVVYILSMVACFPAAMYWCRRMALSRRAGVTGATAAGLALLYFARRRRRGFIPIARPIHGLMP
jgi:hypothetical protein